ncbi:hypothetical protein IFM89_002491 [Coptis chinensis]|uniref:UTP23 sensor motif region domain-containing protein n=1 Tax=Coptis chinensis TaxID=261450 RepID=A0A835HL31_9MAGN|nr:hypothetical protein IFM89_002491 [Coptis chinensis]
MKVKKQKRHRKAVRFYTACFGFHEPYKILCDGTFIHHLLSNQIPLDGHALSNTLGGSTKLFTTRCVMAELKSLGASYSDSFRAAGSLITARCDHEKRKSAKECIEEVIREDNSEHFFVASQDIDLRKKFQEVAGVPVMYGLRNALFLDPPSQSQRKLANEMEEKRLHVTQSEYEVLVKSGRSNLATETAGDAPDTHEDQVGMEESQSRKYPGRRVSNVMDKARFKRKRAKGPNPLSCKKKQNRGNPSSASSQNENVNVLNGFITFGLGRGDLSQVFALPQRPTNLHSGMESHPELLMKAKMVRVQLGRRRGQATASSLEKLIVSSRSVLQHIMRALRVCWAERYQFSRLQTKDDSKLRRQ